MEWTMTMIEPMHASFILGDLEGDTYVPTDDCEEVLEEMIESLINDDNRTLAYRKLIASQKVLDKELMPLLKSTTDDKIFSLAIRFLANVTQPLDTADSGLHDQNGQPVKEMDTLLTEAKHLCTDVRFFGALSSNMKGVINKAVMEDADRQSIHHCVLLLRNLLHLRHGAASNEQTFIAHQCLLSSFFMNELDKMVITLLQHKYKDSWTIGIAQLISFIFKDYSGNLLEPDVDDTTSTSSGDTPNMMEVLVTEGGAGGTFNGCQHPQPAGTVSTTRTLTGNFENNLQILPIAGNGDPAQHPPSHEGDDFMLEVKATPDGHLEIKLTNVASMFEGGERAEGYGASSNDSGDDGTAIATKESATIGHSACTNNSSRKSPLGGTNSPNTIHSRNRSGGGVSNGSHGGGAVGARVGARAFAANNNNYPGNSNSSSEKEVMSSINSQSCLMDMDIFLVYLKKFATNIVYSGLVDLVENIMKALLTKLESILDHSLLMWTVGFFLSFAQQQDLDLAQIKDILNMDLFGFLVYEGVKSCEAMLVRQQGGHGDCAVEKHRLHLVVCTLNQMFRTILASSKSESVRDYLHSLQKYLCRLSDLRNLFVLLIRHHIAPEQSQTYLSDLVQTNHVLMLLMEEWLAGGLMQENEDFSLLTHVNQFATRTVMAKYGSLLEQDDGNRDNLNLAVLTMMYHVAGSCQRHDTIVQLPILKVFSEIWTENALREEGKIRGKNNLASPSLYENEFKDLIEFIFKIYMSDGEKANSAFAAKLLANAESHSNHETLSLESMNTDSDSGLSGKYLGEEEQVLILSWTRELSGRRDAAHVATRRLQNMGFDPPVDQVKKCIEEIGFLPRRQLLESPAKEEEEDAATGIEGMTEEDQMVTVLQELSTVPDEELVPFLVGKVKEEGCGEHLVWLQKQLLEAAYVKLGLEQPAYRFHVEEPVARFYAIQNKAIPLVTWCEELERALAMPHFLCLQKSLGLYTCDDPSIMYPRIPQYLKPLALIEMAGRIGPIDSLPIKFDVSSVKGDGVTMEGVGPTMDGDEVGAGADLDHNAFRSCKPKVDHQWLNIVQAMNQRTGRDQCSLAQTAKVAMHADTQTDG